MNRVQIWLSEKLARWSLNVAPGDYVPLAFALCAGAFSSYTPPSSPEANARTKKSKAKRKRQKERWRALERAAKLENRFDPSIVDTE
jgi:hypothetical protein